MEIVKQNMKVSDEQLLNLLAQIAQPFLTRIELENSEHQSALNYFRNELFFFYSQIVSDFYKKQHHESFEQTGE